MAIRDQLAAYAAIAALTLGVSIINFPAAGATTRTLGVVYPPWWSTAHIWQAAASTGEIVDLGGARFILYLHSEAPGLNVRARRAGAFLVFDAGGFGGCGAAAGRKFN
jgi:hypothetical protein